MKYIISSILFVLLSFSTMSFAAEFNIPQGKDMKNMGTILCAVPKPNGKVYHIQLYSDSENFSYATVNVHENNQTHRLAMLFLSTTNVDGKNIIVYTTRQKYDSSQGKSFTLAMYPELSRTENNKVAIPSLTIESDASGRSKETDIVCFINK